ncbi:PfkB family carbohydrate kinase [Herbiconiux flava]|uniref:RfaE bifunctional protein nucleotidyltransferase chain/domain n=1 Tax=Herbiconiux flava TaxID=881268 RepID=A0A852SSA9_9MICO|nr:PfkB family carbohydrate kinase [Herbiconiux flava]NYD71749.1 rfaE bifunctional protein nucleotidyltransferase chain/domain [Herbiconiux flava]GLK18287.1 bifunctional protein HldE [Herbiconiux flava]
MIVTVVGDVLLDVDLDGRTTKLSPDAPVPVVGVTHRRARAGGAGLVAAMLAGDGDGGGGGGRGDGGVRGYGSGDGGGHRGGLRVELVTALGDDEGAGELRSLLEERAGIRLVAGPSGAPTPVKTRVRTDGHAVARLDEGCDPPPAPVVTEQMLSAVAAAEVIVVADYGRGLTAVPALREALARRAAVVPVIWDPHPAGTEPVPGTAVVTPNLSEALALSGASGRGIAGAARAASALAGSWGAQTVVVTLGHEGALLHRAGSGPLVVPAPRVETLDPCGAGDRFAATLARSLGERLPLPDAVQRAIDEAAAFLGAGGVAGLRAATDPEERAESAVLVGGGREAVAVAARVRAAGGTVVATGGCFDLLHAGHARTLAAARALGDCLIVCLNSDDSVRRLKGADRPIMSQDDRVALLSALECVDAVLVFDEDTPEQAIRRLEPELWVKGGDYVAAALPETAVLAEWGGQTVTVPYHPGRSTTRLASALAKVG